MIEAGLHTNNSLEVSEKYISFQKTFFMEILSTNWEHFYSEENGLKYFCSAYNGNDFSFFFYKSLTSGMSAISICFPPLQIKEEQIYLDLSDMQQI